MAEGVPVGRVIGQIGHPTARVGALSPPAFASSHDFNDLQFFEFALTFHFSVSGFAHDFTFFFSSLAFLVIAFLLLPWARFLRVHG